MKYETNSVKVDAHEIVEIGMRDAHGSLPLHLDNDSVVPVNMSLIMAYEPKVGDYYVDTNGVASLVEKSKFEATHTALERAPAPKKAAAKAAAKSAKKRK